MKKFILPILIILTSVIYGLPHLLLISKLGNSYTPFTLSGSPITRDEAYAYAPEVNYMLKGHLFLKDAYVSEYSNFPTPFMGETAPSLVFALLSKLTGSIENAFIAADFIFPPIIFFLLYIVTNKLIKNRLYSAAIAFLAVIARDFIAVIPFPHKTFQYLTFAEGQNYLLYFSLAFHPQLTFIFFSLCFISFLNLIQSPTRRKYMLFSGILFSFLFYSYIFYWTYFVAFYFLIIVYFLIKKEKQILVSLIGAGAIAFLIATPYLYNIYRFYKLEIAADFIAKSSLNNVPLPITLIRYFLIALLLYLTTRKKDIKFKIFVLFLLAGVLIAPISKLIIGQDLETFHYLRRALMPFATIGLFVTVFLILKNKNIVITFLSFSIIFIFLVYGLNVQMIASEKIQASHIKDLDRVNVFKWLKDNTPKESVVGSVNTDFDSLLPIYTQNRVFFPPTDRTITPTNEGVTRYTILSNLLNINTDWQKNNLDKIISYLFIFQAYDENRSLNLSSDKRKAAEDEIDYESQGLWRESIKKYKLDYIVVTPDEITQTKIDPNILKYEASFGNYFVYFLIK